MLRGIRIAWKTFHDCGVDVVFEATKQEFWRRLRSPGRRTSTPVPPLHSTELARMYRYATCDDMISLRAAYPEYCFRDLDSDISSTWGLKQMGTLFCADKIRKLQPITMIEVGAGHSTFFAEQFASDHEYWVVDDAGFYDVAVLDAAVNRRRSTKFVRGLLGTYNQELPSNYFDLVFSVSVLEHVPLGNSSDVYRDMYRILKPGGAICHSIDLADETRGVLEYSIIKNAGFLVPSRPDLEISVRRGKGFATLFEPLDIVFRYYYGKDRQDMWTNLRSIQGHTPTILVFAQKPRT